MDDVIWTVLECLRQVVVSGSDVSKHLRVSAISLGVAALPGARFRLI